MKKVVSVSLGSSKRDAALTAEFGGQIFAIERIGVDGDIKKAAELLRRLDGKVDAFSLGGTDLYVYVKNKRYMFRETARLAAAAQITPVVDGSGLKNTLERRVITYLEREHNIVFKDKKVLLVSAVDRFGLAESLVAAGADITFGDIIFGLGLSVPLKNFQAFARLAQLILPVIVHLPVRFFYPTGQKQDTPKPRFQKYFDQAQIIAGDFHFIKKNMPPTLSGKTIITNTVTRDDEALLRQRGVTTLITTTPEIGGRAFGTNVLEGILVAYAGRGQESLSELEYNTLLDKIKIIPRVKQLL